MFNLGRRSKGRVAGIEWKKRTGHESGRDLRGPCAVQDFKKEEMMMMTIVQTLSKNS